MKAIKYDSSHLPPEEVWDSIWILLRNNYPESYSEESKAKTLSKRDSSEKINERIERGFIYFTISDTKDKVIGFLEMQTIEVEWWFYIQLCWLVVDSLYQWNGLARKLHDEFEKEAQEIWKTIEWNWCLQLMTGINNPARSIYEKWWYEVYKESGTDVFMIKDI